MIELLPEAGQPVKPDLRRRLDRLAELFETHAKHSVMLAQLARYTSSIAV